jgi:hypothetical protein
MDELDFFRAFRRGVAAPSGDAERRASARLTSAIEGAARASVLRVIRARPGRAALALAALAGVTAAALFFSAPWKSSPGFLERAEAALTPPSGTVLHVKWLQTTTSSTHPSCTATRGPNEMWVDQSPPHRYRMVINDPLPDPVALDPRTFERTFACATGARRVEEGGELDTQKRLEFIPPDTLASTGVGYFGTPDPVVYLREAISDGDAHHEGKTELDGRTVERIRVAGPPDCPVPGCERDPWYVYVDPETFYPVRTESPHGYVTPLAGGPAVRFHTVQRYVTFEYLPRTAANLALTDIRAQHPNAIGP